METRSPVEQAQPQSHSAQEDLQLNVGYGIWEQPLQYNSSLSGLSHGPETLMQNTVFSQLPQGKSDS